MPEEVGALFFSSGACHWKIMTYVCDEHPVCARNRETPMNKIGLVTILCVGAVYGAYLVEFHPTAVAIAAFGFLAYAVFSRSSPRRPASRLYWGD
jgi:hypothetical protein